MTPNWQDVDEEDRGLLYDLPTLVSRRRALGLLGGLGAAGVLAACSSSGAATSNTSTSSGSVSEVPDETSGPYPGDGSNGPDALTESGIVRRDITRSFGTSTTRAEGVPLTIRLTVLDATTGAARKGAAVYLWHCDREGNYSMYAASITNQNYLRGVQPTDDAGTATFTSIYPARYSGRWPHIHFEVYDSVANATSNGQIVKTSQIALPKETCDVVYATSGYEQSLSNLGQVSLQTDMVFSDDGGIHQIPSMSGDTSSGYTAVLTIGV